LGQNSSTDSIRPSRQRLKTERMQS
jgi:hypothetical protein